MRALHLKAGAGKLSRRLLWGLLIALCALGLLRLAEGALVPVKAVVAQILFERSFEQSVATHRALKPWPWADMAPVARLRVPRLGVRRIVLDTGSGQAMAFGPTLLPGAARLDATGTAVIAAHRDTHFRFLKDLAVGDMLAVEDLDGTVRHYRVTGTQIVRWDRFATTRDPGAPTLALATCYPFDAVTPGPLRYVVHARAVDRVATTRAVTVNQRLGQ